MTDFIVGSAVCSTTDRGLRQDFGREGEEVNDRRAMSMNWQIA